MTHQKEATLLSFMSLTVSLAQGNGSSISRIIILVLGLLVTIGALCIMASRLGIPYPVALVLGGLLLGFVPGLPQFTLDPSLVFLLFLPPLLYAAAWQTSWRDFRANLRPISLLALGLVLLTTVLVAVVAHLLIPELPWAVAFALGAIVSPTDAVAATAIAQRLGIPQRIVTIVEGESLVNDATGLVAYRFAVAAQVAAGRDHGQAEGDGSRRSFADQLEENRTWNVLTLEFMLYTLRHPSAQQELAERYRAAQQELTALLEESYQAQGDFPPYNGPKNLLLFHLWWCASRAWGICCEVDLAAARAATPCRADTPLGTEC